MPKPLSEASLAVTRGLTTSRKSVRKKRDQRQGLEQFFSSLQRQGLACLNPQLTPEALEHGRSLAAELELSHPAAPQDLQRLQRDALLPQCP